MQEQTQKEISVTPTYEVLKEKGPDHAKIFTVGVFLNEKQIGLGKGPNKQKAQVKAAVDALGKWQKIKEDKSYLEESNEWRFYH